MKSRIIYFLITLLILTNNCGIIVLEQFQGKTNETLPPGLFLFLTTDQQYSSFALEGNLYDEQNNPIASGTVRILGGIDSYTDSNGYFEAFVSQALTSNSTDVELEILQNDESKGKAIIPIEIDLTDKSVTVKPMKENSISGMRNLGSTGAEVSQSGDFVAYYYLTGTITQSNGNPLSDAIVKLPNKTMVRTDITGNYELPIIQTIKNGRNTLDISLRKSLTMLCNMELVVLVDTETGDTSIESQTDDGLFGCPKDGLSTSKALIVKTGSDKIIIPNNGDVTPFTFSYLGNTGTIGDSTFVFTKNLATTPVIPSLTGETPTSYSISPNLPPGLTFDSTTGQISGVPTTYSPTPVSYTVTATNGTDSVTATISITVQFMRDWSEIQPILQEQAALGYSGPETVSTFGSIGGGDKWYGGVLAPNGKIYGIPRTTTSILVFDPETDTFTTFGSVPSGYYGGLLAPNGKIYAIPLSATNILVIDPETNTTTTFGSVPSGYWGGVLAPNGKIYGMPRNSNQVLVIDTTNNSTNLIGSGLGGTGNRWYGGVLAPNGKIYGIPQAHSGILVIDTKSNGSWDSDMYLSPYFNKF